jgi:stage 0 sporulation regulatory protein
MTSEDLLTVIEEKRKSMIELGLAFSFADERVVRISDHLDKLLNRYQKLVSETGKQ